MDQRVPVHSPELVATLNQSALLAETAHFRVYVVRWEVLDGITAEGLLFRPNAKPKARIVVLPDADQNPEQFAMNQVLAESGCEVLSPVLIDRKDTWSGNPRLQMTNQSHRALDERITIAGVSGYFGPREDVWKQPLYRNVFGLLKDFGDAELASMISPRTLIIDTTPEPTVKGHLIQHLFARGLRREISLR